MQKVILILHILLVQSLSAILTAQEKLIQLNELSMNEYEKKQDFQSQQKTNRKLTDYNQGKGLQQIFDELDEQNQIQVSSAPPDSQSQTLPDSIVFENKVDRRFNFLPDNTILLKTDKKFMYINRYSNGICVIDLDFDNKNENLYIALTSGLAFYESYSINNFDYGNTSNTKQSKYTSRDNPTKSNSKTDDKNKQLTKKNNIMINISSTKINKSANSFNKADYGKSESYKKNQDVKMSTPTFKDNGRKLFQDDQSTEDPSDENQDQQDSQQVEQDQDQMQTRQQNQPVQQILMPYKQYYNKFKYIENDIPDNFKQKVVFSVIKDQNNLQPGPELIADYQENIKQKDNQKWRGYNKQSKLNTFEIMTPQTIVYRSKIYKQNVRKINEHNKDKNRNYTMGLNKFTDMSEKQFNDFYTKLLLPQNKVVGVQTKKGQNKKRLLQATTSPSQNWFIDWRCLAPQPLFQGQCGSCYAISALQAISMTFRINKRVSFDFSIQQIISCATNNVTVRGCSGGYLEEVYNYVRDKGVGQYTLYPYASRSQFNGIVPQCNQLMLQNDTYLQRKYFIKGYQRVPRGDCKRLVQVLKSHAISVAISTNNLQFYQKGTFVDRQGKANHGVTLVGYHPVNKYLILNTWGKQWGFNGYAYVSQQTEICDHAIYPILLTEWEQNNIKQQIRRRNAQRSISRNYLFQKKI